MCWPREDDAVTVSDFEIDVEMNMLTMCLVLELELHEMFT